MELQEAKLKIHQFLYENIEFSNDELKEIRATIIKSEKPIVNKSNTLFLSYYYFGIHYPEGYLELLDAEGKPLRNSSRENLLTHINEARLAAHGNPLYIIKETTEAEKI
jgi:hypothetical protein